VNIPKTLQLRHGKTSLTLLSSGPGKALVSLHSRRVYRHTFRLRPGANKLVLKLGTRFPRGRHRLTLTTLSLSGKRGGTYSTVVSLH
jgi:hypothetical protein